MCADVSPYNFIRTVLSRSPTMLQFKYRIQMFKNCFVFLIHYLSKSETQWHIILVTNAKIDGVLIFGYVKL